MAFRSYFSRLFPLPVYNQIPSVGMILIAALTVSVTLMAAVDVRAQTNASAKRPAKAISPASDASVRSLDEYLKRAVAFGFSGAVLVAKDNKVILNEGYGYANREKRIPITTDTVFDIGSITKQFTAAAIMKLEEQGKVSVQDTLAKHFENVPDDKIGITIHHLLTHTSGLPNYSGDDYELIDRKTFEDRVWKSTLRFKPGKKVAYSNVGYSVLATIVEKVSGQPFESFVREKIFLPAGMQKTGYILPRWDRAALARGYTGLKDQGTPLDQAWMNDGPSWNLRGNGGMLSTLDDLFRWHVALAGVKVLSDASKQKMTTAHAAESDNSSAGYGWFISRTPHGSRVVSHSGSNGIFFMNFRRYIDDGIVTIFATNDQAFDRPMESQLEGRLFREPGQLPPIAAVDVPATELHGYAGNYKLDSGTTVALSIVDGQLSFAPTVPEIVRALTRFPKIKDPDRLKGIDDLTMTVVSGMANKDFEPLRKILRAQTPFDPEKEFWEGAFENWQQRWGKFQNADVLGSQDQDEYVGTYVTLRFERGSRTILFVQNKDGKFFISANPPSLLPDRFRLVALSKTEFAAYNLQLSSGTSVLFQMADGRVKGLTIKGENGDIHAARVD